MNEKNKFSCSEEQLQVFIAHAPVAIAMFDREMRYISVSRRWRSDYGLGGRDLVGLSHYEVFPEIPEHWKAAHRRGLSGEVARAAEDFFERADSSVQWNRWDIQPWHDASGAIGGIILFTEDITERKLMEKALSESEERFRSTFEQAAVGMAHADFNGRYLRVNDRFCQITGYSREELLQKTFSEVTYSEDVDREEELERKLIHLELPRYAIEKRYVRKNGALVWVDLSASLVRDPSGNSLYSLRVIEDVSDRKALEANLREAKEEADVANMAKNLFLANMSHELRTPMTVVMGSLELLKEPGMGQQREQLLEMADASAHRLLGIIDDLLDISKIEARQLNIKGQSFDLRDCIRQAVEIFSSPAREKGLHFHWTVDSQVPVQVNGDPARLGQVLLNLIGNAVKFTRTGEVAASVTEEEGELVFSIRDTGIGIPADRIDQLFTPFSQVDSSMTRLYGGSGLGLAISKELVEMMGGGIRVESEIGKGSIFTFTIPLRRAEKSENAPSSEISGDNTASPLRVLLAEDDPMVRDLIQMILERRGFSMAIAENGRQAVALWRGEHFDLILMDLQMPEMNGLEATRKIRELEDGKGRKTCIFALTAHIRSEDREACLAAGMDGFLTKPLDMKELNKLIETCPYRAQRRIRTP